MQNDKLRNYFHLHFIVLIWGFTAILGKLISIDALPLVWHRMLLATAFVFLFIVFRKNSFRVQKKTLVMLLVTGVVIALHWLTFFKAIKVSNVSVALATMSTGAFFTALLEPILYRRKIIWHEIFLGLLVIIGLGLIFSVDTSYKQGILLALCSAFLAAIFSLANGKLIQKHRPSVISFYELGAGVVFLSIYMIFTNNLSSDIFVLSTMDWVYIFILASFCTAYAFIASVKVMKHLSPYTVMLTTNLEPVYGILLAYTIFGESEKMTGGFYIGAVLILLTVVAHPLVGRLRKQKV